MHVFIAAVQAAAPDFEGPPEDEPLLEFQVADAEVLRQRLTDAGLTDVIVDTATRSGSRCGPGQQLWDWCLGGNPIPGMLVADLTDEQRADASRSSTAWSASAPAVTAPPS